MLECECVNVHEPRQVVLTGGPGAGKTAVLEMLRQSLCRHVKVLPEAAGIVFGGGFPREQDRVCRAAAQRAIYYVQRELEGTGGAHNPAVVLCDRGTLDGLAYWPGSPDDFFSSTGTTLEVELRRYHAVLHLRTPTMQQGYNRQNPLRTESAVTAAEIDERILRAWERHPRRHLIDSTGEFLDKALVALSLLRAELPECCVAHLSPLIPQSGVDALS